VKKDISLIFVFVVLQDSQPSKLVSTRNDLIMEGVENRSRVSDVSMGGHKVEREEGELSPTESCEQENFEVYKENGLEPVQKLPDNEISNTDREPKEGACGTEAVTRSNALPEDDDNKITQKLSEGDENASKFIVSASKFGGQVSSDEEHKGAESENEAGGMVNSNEGEDGSFFTFSERYLQPVKPLAKHVPGTLQASECDTRNDSRVFYGNDSLYVLFRLHQVSATKQPSHVPQMSIVSVQTANSADFPDVVRENTISKDTFREEMESSR